MDDQIHLRDVVTEGLAAMADRMTAQSDASLEQLKAQLRHILAGAGGSCDVEQFTLLQMLMQGRRDLTPEALVHTHRAQLEILVAIKTGIQAFLHPDISVTQSLLIEVFFHRRCRNVACQSELPVGGCGCNACGARTGFCKACMCLICSKFDFEVNTCTWVGCDFCSHWTHTDCAIRDGQIHVGSRRNSVGSQHKRPRGRSSEMIFECRACGRMSELFGWVKDVFRACGALWDRDGLMKELDCVRRIFHGSEDKAGKQLFCKSEDLLEKLKDGIDPQGAFKEMQHFFLDMEGRVSEDSEDEHGKVVEAGEACDSTAEAMQQAVHKMGFVSSEKVVDLKRAKLVLEICDRELDEKRRELGDLQIEKQRKRQEINELEKIIRLKQAEAEMFQMRANEAQREADELAQIAQVQLEKTEKDYASKYLKLRLEEAEAERMYLFEKMKMQEYSKIMPDSSHNPTRSVRGFTTKQKS